MAKKKTPTNAENKSQKPAKKETDAKKKRPRGKLSEQLEKKLGQIALSTKRILVRIEGWPDDPDGSTANLRSSASQIVLAAAKAAEHAGALPDNWPPKTAQIEIDFPVKLKLSKAGKYTDLFESPADVSFIVCQISERWCVVKDKASGAKHRIAKGDLISYGPQADEAAELPF
jgi:hypothetical protein